MPRGSPPERRRAVVRAGLKAENMSSEMHCMLPLPWNGVRTASKPVRAQVVARGWLTACPHPIARKVFEPGPPPVSRERVVVSAGSF